MREELREQGFGSKFDQDTAQQTDNQDKQIPQQE
jgi:hypothetical protein